MLKIRRHWDDWNNISWNFENVLHVYSLFSKFTDIENVTRVIALRIINMFRSNSVVNFLITFFYGSLSCMFLWGKQFTFSFH
jgi:hypothetical protein